MKRIFAQFNQSLNSDSILTFLFVIMIPVLVSIKVLGNIILLLISIIGIYRLIKEKINPFKEKSLRIFSTLTVGYFFIMLFSIFMNSGISEDLTHIARKLHFLFAPFIAIAFYKKFIAIEKLLFSSKIATILASIIVILGLIFSGESRPSGMINSNVFSDIVVTIMFFSLSNIFLESRKEFLISILSFLSGSFILLTTISRGSWIAYIILLISFIFLSIKLKDLLGKNRKRVSIVFLVFIGVTLFHSLKINGVFNETINNAMNYSTYSSSNIRLQIWDAAVDALEDAPWYGYGYRLANKKVSEYSENNSEIISKFTHLHNEYLTNLLSAGYMGLIAVLALLFVPLYYFAKELFSCQKFQPIMLGGIILCTSYAIFGITHIAFGEEHVNALYIFLLAYLMPRIFRIPKS